MSNPALSERVTAAVAIALVLLTAPPRDASAQPVAEAGSQASTAPRVVLFTASGGIAKGSYQGGVDWTITEFLRRLRDPAFKDMLRLQGVDYVLGTATGASAGNIDALFTAIHYCTERPAGATSGTGVPIRAEDSLFWKAWVTTGTQQLLPDDLQGRTPEPAALDRGFFEQVYLPAIQDALDGSVSMAVCDVPVGLTLTRIEPVEVRLVDNSPATAAVQRFATVFNVRRAPNGRLDLAAPSPGVSARKSLGALALLEPDASGRIRTRDAFNAVVASSSFPVAFAPRTVKYTPGGLGGDAAPEMKFVETAFSDGGVFDNNPMSLAVGLYELQPNRASAADLVYSSPGNYRQPMLDARTPCSPLASSTARAEAIAANHCDGREVSGLGAATELLSGAYEAARQYELQAFARQLDRDRFSGGKGVVPDLRLSSRAHAIVGETLWSFGAFLGRPFREHDFYAGIYDGLELVAREFLCRGEADVPACTKARHAELVTANQFGLSDEALATVSWLLEQEQHVATASAKPSDRWTLIRAILDGLPRPSTKPEAYAECARVGGLVAQHMCPGGLDRLVSRLRRNADVRAAVTRLRAWCETENISEAMGDCPIDGHFEALLAKPGVHVYKLEKRAIENLELAEDNAKVRQLTEYTSLVELAFSVFRTATYRYRDGALGPFEFVMSSARGNDPTDKLALALGYAVPTYFQWTYANGRKDILSLGWRPVTWVWSEKAHVNYTTEVSLTESSKGPFFRQAVSHAVGLGSYALTRHAQLLSAVEIGALFPSDALWHSLPGGRADAKRLDRMMGRLVLRGVSDKIQLTVAGRKGVLTFGLGVNDINGVVFWIKR